MEVIILSEAKDLLATPCDRPMMSRRSLAALLVLIAPSATAAAQPGVQHHVYFNTKRVRIAEPWFLEAPTIADAQLKYTWAELEPKKDRYAFGAIRRDLAALRSHGKRLFMQLQDVSFYASIINVPPYLLADTAYQGGQAANYREDRDSAGPAQGYVARRWDPAAELVDFASNVLGVRYIFWEPQEPFFTAEVLPFIRAQR